MVENDDEDEDDEDSNDDDNLSKSSDDKKITVASLGEMSISVSLRTVFVTSYSQSISSPELPFHYLFLKYLYFFLWILFQKISMRLFDK